MVEPEAAGGRPGANLLHLELDVRDRAVGGADELELLLLDLQPLLREGDAGSGVPVELEPALLGLVKPAKLEVRLRPLRDVAKRERRLEERAVLGRDTRREPIELGLRRVSDGERLDGVLPLLPDLVQLRLLLLDRGVALVDFDFPVVLRAPLTSLVDVAEAGNEPPDHETSGAEERETLIERIHGRISERFEVNKKGEMPIYMSHHGLSVAITLYHFFGVLSTDGDMLMVTCVLCHPGCTRRIKSLKNVRFFRSTGLRPLTARRRVHLPAGRQAQNDGD